jgi:serine protease Do
MKKQTLTLPVIIIVSAMVLAACSPTTTMTVSTPVPPQAAAQPTAVPPVVSPADTSLLSAYETTLESVYASVSPSVVEVNVTLNNTSNFGLFSNGTQSSSALGSGFVWDTSGNIVTNDHVVEGATSINVTFADGTILPATVVATDPYSDLAVIKVDVSGSGETLNPVTVADSSQVKVGQVVIAIGNPFGEENTMTSGIVSGLGRSIPSNNNSNNSNNSNPNSVAPTATYSIPGVIQTDAPINPGNSGGVLLDTEGHVIGVTSAIESSSGSSSGVGFAIPSALVMKVIPALISSGHYDHPYIGITGGTLIPEFTSAMNLPAGTLGALVINVTPGGPAANAGLKGSTQQVTINGQQAVVGGDVITAIDGAPIKSIDDLISYLAGQTSVGQKVTLSIIRNGSAMTVDVTLGARPAQ